MPHSGPAAQGLQARWHQGYRAGEGYAQWPCLTPCTSMLASQGEQAVGVAVPHTLHEHARLPRGAGVGVAVPHTLHEHARLPREAGAGCHPQEGGGSRGILPS